MTFLGRRPSSSSVILFFILLLGAALRVTGFTFGLPNPEIRPDENVVVGIALGMTYAGLNPHFFHWPSLELYAVATVYRLWFIYGHWQGWYHIKFDMFRAAAADATGWMLVPRAIAEATGIATIYLVYALTRELWDKRTALLASFFLAVAFLHVRDSHFGVTDTPATFLVVAAMLPLARLLGNRGTRRDWILAGVLSGLAASTKYNGGLVVVAGIAVAVVKLVDTPPQQSEAWRKDVLRGLGVMAIASALAFLAGTPFALLDARHFLEGLRFDSEHLMAGHGMKLERGWAYHLWFSLWYGLGPPMLMAGAAGMVLMARASWRKALVLCSFPVLYYALVGRGYTVFARYIDPVVPFLCITAAILVTQTIEGLRLKRTSVAVALVATLGVLLAVPSLRRDIAFDRLIRQDDTRLLARVWLDQHRAPSDLIMESSPAIVHPTFAIAPPMLVKYDRGQSVFTTEKGEQVEPEWLVLPRGPLAIYMEEPAALHPVARRDYRLVASFVAGGPESPLIFDQQDMFFVPMGEFTARERSGPDIYIYRRRGREDGR